ncbi:MAG: response regulator [Candidatus Omnitrophica bacterium]|nr:response regulator [Candidatus Omnitrophota bacterium]
MSYTILLVDDDKPFREEFKDFLSDYRIVEAGNGQEALNLLKKPNEIDLVILDVYLPGESGTAILKKMKQLDENLPIVILTGYSSKDIAIEALKANADDYIEKPLNLKKIDIIIDHLLKSKKIVIKDSSRIDRVKTFTERNYDKKITLKQAANVVFLSPKYLSRLFKKETGIEFSEYRLKVKMEKAKEILLQRELTIDQISLELGYKNSESFIRIFKRFTKKTPFEFKKEQKIKAGKKRK